MAPKDSAVHLDAAVPATQTHDEAHDEAHDTQTNDATSTDLESSPKTIASTDVPHPPPPPPPPQQQQQQNNSCHCHAAESGSGSGTEGLAKESAPDAQTTPPVAAVSCEGNAHDRVASPTEVILVPPGPRDDQDNAEAPPAPVLPCGLDPSSPPTADGQIYTLDLRNKAACVPLPTADDRVPNYRTPPRRGSDAPADESIDPEEDKMPFGGGKTLLSTFGHTSAGTSALRRRNYASTNALTDYEADLTSKDRQKQKEAVKKFLQSKVKSDWNWEWPPADPESSPEAEPTANEAETVDQVYWKERDEWLSGASESEGDTGVPRTTWSPDTPTPTSKASVPFKFDSPEGVGEALRKTHCERKQRRKKRLAEDVKWNDGLRCFVERRDAWTGARRVPRSVMVSRLPRRESTSSGDASASTAIETGEGEEWEDDVEIPIAPSLIPPENNMRASITPSAYNTIYDKVIVQALTPSCPMNLRDITRSCVQGWKRDGEWPPKSSVAEGAKKSGRKMSIASLFGVEKREKQEKPEPESPAHAQPEGEKEKKHAGGGIRRGLQKLMNLGHSVKDGAKEDNGSAGKSPTA